MNSQAATLLKIIIINEVRVKMPNGRRSETSIPYKACKRTVRTKGLMEVGIPLLVNTAVHPRDI